MKKESMFYVNSPSRDVILIDPEDISNVRDSREYTEIFFKSGGSVRVKESVYTIAENIRENKEN